MTWFPACCPPQVLTLSEAQSRLREAAERLMQGDEAAQADYDTWDKYVSNHPEHIARQEAAAAAWLESNRPINAEALRLMRTWVPPDIWRSDLASLKGMLGPSCATRIWQKKVCERLGF
jgi:hypothetical protein